MSRYYTMTFWVWDAQGKYVTKYDRKAPAVAHAERIGGTWTRQRY